MVNPGQAAPGKFGKMIGELKPPEIKVTVTKVNKSVLSDFRNRKLQFIRTERHGKLVHESVKFNGAEMDYLAYARIKAEELGNVHTTSKKKIAGEIVKFMHVEENFPKLEEGFFAKTGRRLAKFKESLQKRKPKPPGIPLVSAKRG